jgi:hypothetical protein
MKIVIETIPHSQQRYDTIGDWFYADDGTLYIKVSSDIDGFESDNAQFLVALHELVEVWLCQSRGITQAQVDHFDFNFNAFDNTLVTEPGDHPDAPYRREHRFAMMIEHLVAHELGMTGYGLVK